MTLTRNLPLVPEQSVLLFIDVQNFSAHRQGAEFAELPEAEFDTKYGWYFERVGRPGYTQHADDPAGLPGRRHRGALYHH